MIRSLKHLKDPKYANAAPWEIEAKQKEEKAKARVLSTQGTISRYAKEMETTMRLPDFTT